MFLMQSPGWVNGLASTAGITWSVKKKPLCATRKAVYPLSSVVKRIYKIFGGTN
jgi:hypothetical protein